MVTPDARLRVQLPRGRSDLARQLSLFATAYCGYQIVRGLVRDDGVAPFANATRVIDLERALHVFWEPALQSWLSHHLRWVIELCDWIYLDAHFAVTVLALGFIYLRRNSCFYFVRNMFAIAMLIALVGYAVFPTAPPWLMPQWGFSDSIREFTGVDLQTGATGALVNSYAAIPSMHVCFALMTGVTMSRLVRHRAARIAWRGYPALIAFVVVATGNHYFTDVALGTLTAGFAALLAGQLLARARPDIWRFGELRRGGAIRA